MKWSLSGLYNPAKLAAFSIAQYLHDAAIFINALRAHLAELGLVAAQGNAGLNELRAIVTDEQDTRLPISDGRTQRPNT
jgi:hypothetical protein